MLRTFAPYLQPCPNWCKVANLTAPRRATVCPCPLPLPRPRLTATPAATAAHTGHDASGHGGRRRTAHGHALDRPRTAQGGKDQKATPATPP